MARLNFHLRVKLQQARNQGVPSRQGLRILRSYGFDPVSKRGNPKTGRCQINLETAVGLNFYISSRASKMATSGLVT